MPIPFYATHHPRTRFSLASALHYAPMKPRLLVTGGAGFLGNHLLRRAKDYTAAGTLHHTAATAIPGITFHVCDLQQPEEVRILLDRVRPEIIIHTACSDKDDNLSAILPAAGLLAIQSAERHIRFIHISTDQVYDGTGPHNEGEIKLKNYYSFLFFLLL